MTKGRWQLYPGKATLIGMRERARTLGCKLEFVSTPNVGTEVTIRVAARKAYADRLPEKRWRSKAPDGGLFKPGVGLSGVHLDP